MASFDPINTFDYDSSGPPPRPTTPPVRRGFLMVLAVLSLLAILVYGVPHLAERAGYAWESGRSRAAAEALRQLDKEGIVNRASILFRLANAKVVPAVVNIQNLRPGGGGFRGGRPVIEAGSGFVIDARKGYIVTNNHVVSDASDLVVRLASGRQVPGRIVGTDPKTDLAVVQVEGPLKVQAEWGDSDAVEVGDWVLAIGSPMNLEQSVTAGIISAVGRHRLGIVGEGAYEDFLQTDASLNPGNSGGPLIDLNGRVVGVNTAIISQSGGDQGLGLAISAKLARRVVEDLIKNGRVERGYMGVAIRDLQDRDLRRLRIEDNTGALIAEVEPESPAARAGLEVDDVVTRVGDRPVTDQTAFRLIVAETPAGTELSVRLIRDGKVVTKPIRVGTMPALIALGAQLRPFPPELLGSLPDHPDEAVAVMHVEPNSPAARAGLQRGMRVVEVAGKPVSTPAEAYRAAAPLGLTAAIPIKVQMPNGQFGEIVLSPKAH